MISNMAIKHPVLEDASVSLFLKREDLIHPFVSGNKYRKLKYNLQQAKVEGKDVLLTYGGAFSNHIAAVASAGKMFNLKTIGIIRGEELADKPLNSTLRYAEACGMQLHFVSREAYRLKETPEEIHLLRNVFGDFYRIPEGGTNALAVNGCKEIITEKDKEFDYLAVSVGTGGTMAGIIEASDETQEVIGFSALKGTFQLSEIKKYTSKNNFMLTDRYCFGGYSKVTPELIQFINLFKKNTNILLDPVYTGKMIFGIIAMVERGYFKKNSRILAVHTGGLQGIPGMNVKLEKKNLPQIIV
ncbi:1-aminocyclopropane-1-carboxylate deaminase [Cochleicola gelatinilyticus]|uniref:1-aminocyclopropane-1-carboxylate deaminase n=2 Tax=Cochleicola gelatinilyticus TaxID=1763537 RepID=A0A167JEQ9_9FLAO|nr:1-aminocyclopropane-1-carboxylate deaminase [Cochleicola gelatinilyticus]